MDFRVNSDTSTATTPLLHCDSITHGIAIGKEDPAATHLVDVAAVSGKSIKTAGTIDVTGSITATADLTIAGKVIANSVESVATDGAGDDCSNTHTTSLVSTTSSSGAGALADGTVGQIKFISMISVGSGGDDYVLTPANFKNGSTITFDAVGDCATLVFQSGGWTLVGGFGIAVA